MNLYKYRPYNEHTFDMLINRKIHFSSPKYFNDPFDTSIDILREDVQSNSSLTPEEFNRNKRWIESWATTQVVSCFSKSERNILLWSHYADDHKGICFGFETENNNWGGTIRKIIYKNEMPKFTDTNMIGFSNFVMEYLTTKYIKWKYEQEYRMIQDSGKHMHFSKDLLKKVIFGMLMPMEKRETIINLIHSIGYPNVKYFEAKRKTGVFELDIIRWEINI